MNKKTIQFTVPIVTLLGGILLSTTEVSGTAIDLNEKQKIETNHVVRNPLDVTVGWKIDFKSSLPNIHAQDVFLEGKENASLHQKMLINNAANIGEVTLHATKKIPMKKGKEYKINLIYAMQFNKTGKGFIDFNGDRITSADPNVNNAKDHSYTKTIQAKEDMDYTITIDYKIPKISNVYLKLAFDTKGAGGIVENGKLEAPLLEAPQANQKVITGKGQAGNTIEIKDSAEKILGTGQINENGTFSITANRLLSYNETIKGVQIAKDGTRSEEATIKVVDTIAPEAPKLEKITTESKQVHGTTEANALVDLTIGTDTYQEFADNKGNFTIYLDQSYDFDTKVSATATDLAGNVSEATNQVVVYANELNVTFTDTISSIDTEVTGETTRKEVEVEIKINSRVFKVKSDEEGKFVLTLPRMYPVGTKIIAKVIDENNQSKTAETIVIPRVPSIKTLREGDQKVIGMVDSKAKVEAVVYHGEEIYQFEVVADDKGNYEIELKDDIGQPFKLLIGDSVEVKSVFAELGMESEKTIQGIFSF